MTRFTDDSKNVPASLGCDAAVGDGSAPPCRVPAAAERSRRRCCALSSIRRSGRKCSTGGEPRSRLERATCSSIPTPT